MLFSRYCERLPGSTKIGNSARVRGVHCAKVASDLEAQSSEPIEGRKSQNIDKWLIFTDLRPTRRHTCTMIEGITWTWG